MIAKFLGFVGADVTSYNARLAGSMIDQHIEGVYIKAALHKWVERNLYLAMRLESPHDMAREITSNQAVYSIPSKVVSAICREVGISPTELSDYLNDQVRDAIVPFPYPVEVRRIVTNTNKNHSGYFVILPKEYRPLSVML